MKGKDRNSELPLKISENKKVVIKFPDDVSQNLKRTIENFIYFLLIIAASAILISGIGLKNSLYSFLSNNQFNIAIYKSLGLKFKKYKNIILLTNTEYFSFLLSYCLHFKFINNLFIRL